MIQKQFILTYTTSLNKEDIDNMTPQELRKWYNKLIEIKQIEADALNSQ